MLADQQQRDAALNLGKHVLAVAPAGSGKTGLLVRRALRALAASEQPEQVVCITFTRKAAAEIRHRMVAALQSALGPAPESAWEAQLHADASAALARDRQQGWQLLDNPARIRATTIDAFNQRLASQLPLLSGLGGAVTQLQAPAAQYHAAVLAAVARLDDSDLPRADQRALLDVLAWANNRLDTLLPALAGLLARRDQWLGLLRPDPAEADAVLRALLAFPIRQLDSLFGEAKKTLIVQALQVASTLAPAADWAAELQQWPAVSAEHVALWRGIATSLSTQTGIRSTLYKKEGFSDDNPHKPALKALLSALKERPDAESVVDTLLAVRALPDLDWPADYARLRDALMRVLTLVYAELRIGFGQAGEADFPEIAAAAVAAASGQLGPEALRASDADIRHLLVDEMQDTSAAQVQLLEELTQNWEPGDGRSLFLVGDPQQSIYGFRNAQVRLFMQMMGTAPRHADARLGGLPLQVQQLQSNFRSTRTLVDWFNARFASLFPARDDPWAGVVSASACAPAPAASSGPAVECVAVADNEAEAVATRVQALLQSTPAEQRIGVLAPSRTHLEPVLAELLARGVDEVQALDVQALAAHPAVVDFVHLVCALRQPADLLAWAVLLRAPWVGLSWSDLLALSRGRTKQSWPERFDRFAAGEVTLSDDGAARLRRLLGVLDAAETGRARLVDGAEQVWRGLGAPACVSEADRQAVRLAMRCLRDHEQGGEIEDWASAQRALHDLYRPPGQGRVEVTTVHKSKGLEYDHVLVVGCGGKPYLGDAPMLHVLPQQAGVLLAPKPSFADDPGQGIYDLAGRLQRAAQANERLRLLYVAATRARQSLCLIGTAAWRKRSDTYEPVSGSFMAALSAQFRPSMEALPMPDEAVEAQDEFEYLTQWRVPADWSPAPSSTAWLPSEQRARKPSEASLSPAADDGDAADLPVDGDLYAQLVGTMVHLALERVAIDGPEAWRDGGKGRREAMLSGLLRMGLPPGRGEEAVTRVVELVSRTLASESGQWVLRDWPWWQNEYPLAGWLDGAWVSAVIDRCFEDDDGVLWVVDYKTAAYPSNESAEDYATRMRQKYAAQLAQYAELLRELRPGSVIRCGLLLAETGSFIELDLNLASR